MNLKRKPPENTNQEKKRPMVLHIQKKNQLKHIRGERACHRSPHKTILIPNPLHYDTSAQIPG